MQDAFEINHDKDEVALRYTWIQYRLYAKTSRNRKREITIWRFRIFILGVAGAVFGVLCQQSIQFELNKILWQHLPTLLGMISAFILGVATYFGKELVNPEQERQWIRSRSIAEALKSESYLFVTGVKPYDKDDRSDRLLKETKKLLESVNGLTHESLSEEGKSVGLPSDKITTKDYIEQRVNDQIDHFYRKKSREYIIEIGNFKKIGLILGIIAIALGALGSTGWTAGWVAVISTLSASITAYVYASRYQYLIVSYQATANRLEFLRTHWLSSGKTDTDKDDRDKFILDCEDAISIENNAWMAEITKVRNKTLSLKNY
ncbi:MAG: DUF4231 domain-containing protein [Desulfobacteraceae bacterium]|jgi:hypothetical protein